MQSPTTKQPKKSGHAGTRRRVKLLLGMMFAFMLWAVFTVWDQAGQFRVKAEKLSELEEQLQAAKKQQAELKLDITRLNDPEFLEQLIRKDYHYVRPGETPFLITD